MRIPKVLLHPPQKFLVILGQALPASLVPCWWVGGGCGARAVSRKTPFYYILPIDEVKDQVYISVPKTSEFQSGQRVVKNGFKTPI